MANEVRIRITADDQASPTMDRVKASTVAMGVALGGLALEATRQLASVAGDVIRTGVSFNAMKEQAQIAFTTMLGSGEKAKAFLDELQTFAAKTPFEFPDLLKASQRLQAMGFESEQVIPLMTAIGDAVAGLGGGAAEIDRAVIALGQMEARGKTTAQEMNQLTELGIPAWKSLAEAIGVSIPEAMDLVSKGAIDAQTTITAVTEGMERDFGGMMDQQSRTWNGMISTIKDNSRILAGEVAAPLFEQLKGTMARFMDWFEQNQDRIKDVAKRIGQGIGAIADAVTDFATFIIDHWGSIWPVLRVAWETSGLSTIVKVIQTLNEFRDHWRDTANDVIGFVEDMINKIIEGLNTLTDRIGDFIEMALNPLRQAIGKEAIQIAEGGLLGNVSLPGINDPNKWAVPGPPESSSAANGGARAISDLSAAIGSGTKAAKGMTDAERALDELRQETARTVADIQKSLLDEQITAYYEGGQQQLDAVKATQDQLMVQVRERAAELMQKWGLDFPDALGRAFTMVKSGIDSITESARKLQDFGLSLLQQNAQRNVRYAPGVLESIAKATGLNSFDGGGYVDRDQLALVHRGETVVPAGGGMGTSITVNLYGVITDPVATGQEIARAINRAATATGPLISSQAVS